MYVFQKYKYTLTVAYSIFCDHCENFILKSFDELVYKSYSSDRNLKPIKDIIFMEKWSSLYVFINNFSNAHIITRRIENYLQ